MLMCLCVCVCAWNYNQKWITVLFFFVVLEIMRFFGQYIHAHSFRNKHIHAQKNTNFVVFLSVILRIRNISLTENDEESQNITVHQKSPWTYINIGIDFSFTFFVTIYEMKFKSKWNEMKQNKQKVEHLKHIHKKPSIG